MFARWLLSAGIVGLTDFSFLGRELQHPLKAGACTNVVIIAGGAGDNMRGEQEAEEKHG